PERAMRPRASPSTAATVNGRAKPRAAPAPDLPAAAAKSEAQNEPRDKPESAGGDAAIAPGAVTPAANPDSSQAVANAAPAPDLPAVAAKPEVREEPRDKR